jgi:hypothetical protein
MNKKEIQEAIKSICVDSKCKYIKTCISDTELKTQCFIEFLADNGV